MSLKINEIRGLTMVRQTKISSNSNAPEWLLHFESRESQYLINIVNSLIDHTDFDISIDYTNSVDKERVFHIYEPFIALNYLGFMSPSVVSLKFKEGNKVEFWSGDDNGLNMFSERLVFEKESTLPSNPHQSIDFWHFVDSIGTLTDD
ncbi:hypothetical protein [Psychrobacter sp. PSP]|jgi:hypothetical protein|uniref:hypothetical protein n=1 Tax=Psychrobacter sp. PSP TaxID=2734636 RepID=UPI002095A1BD|nr:hypothetical protein [Psychrobacter sp. PSP]